MVNSMSDHIHEDYPHVMCEVCGTGSVAVDDVAIQDLYRAIDLWVCNDCLYIHSFIDMQIEQSRLVAEGQQDLDTLFNVMKIARKTGALHPFSKRPMPKIHKPLKLKGRIDTIILTDDID